MRLIDANALIETLRESKYMIYHANATIQIILNKEIERSISFVETAPTIKTFTLADIEEQYRKGMEKGLEERQHGEWIYHKYDRDFECSICNTRYDAFDLPVKTWDYCPSCGQKMETEGGEAE